MKRTTPQTAHALGSWMLGAGRGCPAARGTPLLPGPLSATSGCRNRFTCVWMAIALKASTREVPQFSCRPVPVSLA